MEIIEALTWESLLEAHLVLDLEVQGEQGDLEARPPREDSASLAIQSPTGRASVIESVQTATSVDIKQNGVVIKIRHPHLPEQDAGGGTEATSSDSESESPTRADALDPALANRANRISFTANMTVRSDLNKKLSNMNSEEVKEVFRALRAAKDDSPMTTTNVFKEVKGRRGVSVTTCWDTGCTFPIASLAVIKQLKAEIIPLTQDLTIVEASGSELSLLGTATIFMETEVLGIERKELEVAVIEGVEGNKEILISLKLMKMWGMVHGTFPKETVDNFVKRMQRENKYN